MRNVVCSVYVSVPIYAHQSRGGVVVVVLAASRVGKVVVVCSGNGFWFCRDGGSNGYTRISNTSHHCSRRGNVYICEQVPNQCAVYIYNE